jgi:hypothetical protein
MSKSAYIYNFDASLSNTRRPSIGAAFFYSLMLGERASGVEKNRPLIPLLTAKIPATRVNSAVVLFCAFSGEFDRFEAKNNGVAQ